MPDPDSDAFAAIIAELDDPEWRRRRREAASMGAVILVGAVLIVRVVLSWSAAATLAFALAFVGGVVGGLLVVRRALSAGAA